MKKVLKRGGLIFSVGMILTLASLGGTGGCGGGDEQQGTGIVNEEATAALLVSPLVGFAGFSEGSGTALVSQSGAVGLKAQTGCTGTNPFTCPCDFGGTVTTEVTETGDVILTFNDCISDEGNVINGPATYTTISDTSTLITFNDLTLELESCGIFTINETEIIEPTDVGVDLVMNLTITIDSDTFNVIGDATVADNGNLTGTIDFSGAINIDCTFSDDPQTCPGISEACSLNASDLCVGDEFAENLCQSL